MCIYICVCIYIYTYAINMWAGRATRQNTATSLSLQVAVVQSVVSGHFPFLPEGRGDHRPGDFSPTSGPIGADMPDDLDLGYSPAFLAATDFIKDLSRLGFICTG